MDQTSTSVVARLRRAWAAGPGLVMVLACTGLAACGQKGPLVLPKAASAGAAASAPVSPP